MRINSLRFRLSLNASTPIRLLVLGMWLACSAGSIAKAQTTSSGTMIFENVTLSPNFAPDPTTVRGISGGARAASDLAGRAETATGACNGFVDQQPDHTMVLTQYFDYLSLQVQSPDDTTLIIKGPGGTWCNDDYTGKDPGIAGKWLSGTYQIWVGSYAPDKYSPYVIRITEQH